MYSNELAKRAKATELFREHAANSRIVVSTQVVQEFYAASSRKLGMPRREAYVAVQALLDLPLVLLGASHVTTAIRNEESYQVSFWDGLILAAAQSAGAEILYTEDLNDGQLYGTVLVQNPFRLLHGK
jgi:predicted nucleic acid-binding protein